MANPKTTDPMRDEILEFVRKSEETVAQAGRKWGETLCDLVPGDGKSIRKVVGEAFDFTETIVKNQREFANSVIDRVLGEVPSNRSAAAAKGATTKPAHRRTTGKATGHAGAV